MRPDQIDLITAPSSLRVHPDGTWAVVAATHPSFTVDGYVGQLWKIPLSGGAPRRITRGQSDSNPRFSPDGTLLGFLRPDADSTPQLFVVESAGGEPVQLTDQRLGVSSFEFAPGGGRVVFTARVPDPDRYGTLDGVSADQEDPRGITTYQTRMNGAGWIFDKPNHVFEVRLPDLTAEPPLKPTGRAARDEESDKPSEKPESANSKKTPGVPPATQLTSGAFDDTEIAFDADGGILFTSPRHDGHDNDLRSDIYRLSGDEPVAITPGAPLAAVRACLSGGTLFFGGADLGASGTDFVGSNNGVYVLEDAKARRLSDAESQSVLDLAPGPDGTVLAIVNERGSGVIHKFSATGPEQDVEIPAHGSVHEVRAIPGSTDVLAIVATETDPGEVVRIGPLGDVTVLTVFNADLVAKTTPVKPIDLTSHTDDGYPVQGWVFVPSGEGPHPVLLNIHGGPAASYGPSWFDEAQVYVSAGYAVVMCNPRGSDGYGAAHEKAIVEGFGDRDMADVLGFLDHALATVPGLDKERVGVMGGSYGGYLTAWIIGHDHRFQAAIVERGYLDPWLFIGASDIGWFFGQEYNGPDKATMDTQSPMLAAGNVTTPTLVLHSEKDQRCPIGQGFQYYTLLKQNGVDAEMLVFPGETHELSRSGTPWHRRQRFEAILDWWKRKMPVSA